ncbi:molybdenum cofactor cytidylyltransferase [Maribacter spongiicola]|uniref:Molybdenum cofactor cytidylyltransferase n=1 Tax=Maribacter spongiicola TaxID=1206753 RepID=A0A4R7K2Z8_9FLAO|nr:nucleotidyltransferase family protein [Maribacter spongiicola]TDT45231.1 molybdenum cofactor cytidylyltransferase [Maribacter spongiicola]
MKTNLDIAVLIMAAGASRRMDGIKQLMPWRDSNFLLETIKTVQNTNAKSLHVVLGSNADFITTQCSLEEKNIDIIVNANWENGLGDSIAHGVKILLQQRPALDGVLICLADQPLLSFEYLNSLIAEFIKHPSKIIATNYGKKVGVPALFPKLLFEELSVLKGDFGAKEILNNKSNVIISLDAADQIADVDTSLEYQNLINRTNNTLNS